MFVIYKHLYKENEDFLKLFFQRFPLDRAFANPDLLILIGCFVQVIISVQASQLDADLLGGKFFIDSGDGSEVVMFRAVVGLDLQVDDVAGGGHLILNSSNSNVRLSYFFPNVSYTTTLNFVPFSMSSI